MIVGIEDCIGSFCDGRKIILGQFLAGVAREVTAQVKNNLAAIMFNDGNAAAYLVGAMDDDGHL